VGLAVGAEAPKNNFGFVNHKAVVGDGFQARRLPGRAVNVYRGVALPADEVMVVVADAVLVEGRTTRGFDSADESGGDERVEVVVHGLAGKGSEPVPGGHRDELGGLVLPFVANDVEHGQPRGGDPQPRRLQTRFNVSVHSQRVPGFSGHSPGFARFWLG